MKTFFTVFLITLTCGTFAQINSTWYAVKVNDMAFITITPKYLVQGYISNYNTPKQYVARADTFTIRQRFTKGDSVFYFITNKDMDQVIVGNDNQQLSINKFRYSSSSNTLSTFFFTMSKTFIEQAEKKNLNIKEVAQFAKADQSTDSYLTYYPLDSMQLFLKYPKVIDQPREKILALYQNLTTAYEKIKALPPDQKLVYGSLWAMVVPAIEVPEYLKLKICPLVKPENFDEIPLREKYKGDNEMQVAISKLRRARSFGN